jgi:GNAT superfamily N-acetyltransferase
MPAPTIYYSAISLADPPTRRARAELLDALAPHARDPATSVVSVCDTWGSLDLGRFGLTRRSSGRWFARPAGPTPEPAAGGPRIEPVRDAGALAAFERTMVTAFGARPPVAPFDIHGLGILDDPAMHVLGGWVGDELVATSMAYVTDVLGVFGVATLPAHRGRGAGRAMTTAALAVAPDRPAVLQPTAPAESLYRRLGFADVGRFAHWA